MEGGIVTDYIKLKARHLGATNIDKSACVFINKPFEYGQKYDF